MLPELFIVLTEINLSIKNSRTTGYYVPSDMQYEIHSITYKVFLTKMLKLIKLLALTSSL